MKTRRLLVLQAGFVLSTYAFAQNQAPDPEVILNRCGQAMGSPQHAFSVLAEGEERPSDTDAAKPVRIETRGLDDFRIERGSAGELDLAIISKGGGWHHRQNQKSAMSRHTTAYFTADHLPALVCGVAPASRGMRAVYVGSEVLGATPVFHLRLNASPRGKNKFADTIESLLSEYHVFIDQQTFRVLKTSKLVFSPEAVENHSVWETCYSDYRSVNGVLMPFHIENFVAGQRFSTTVFSNIQGDVVLSDNDFREAQ